ncbi:unnamed protein product [Didymodactylos carnosus]|uniref:G-protein coupled receptors family 1 profile domain-containing protein n=1 Tax=Didymodactylos carnosus TaxID=1234261 RepID=A0A8S2EGV0_9BILA|nr:unnamed protein product [Didymodactylos carnosus]CAF4029513.1 unnamed protein product [Didymodactylos carnosus]
MTILSKYQSTFTTSSVNQTLSYLDDKDISGIDDLFIELNYDKYVFFAIASALFGLPGNILLLVILIKISFNRGRNRLSSGSFERFLFEIVLIDTLLIIYHFVDNFLSYIDGERSAGQHYLIHISDFCCKFFTYIAKMSVLLTTWLLLFLIINRIILTEQSCWNRKCIHFVNAKYTTVFLIFIFSVYNIYPIEVLKYQKKIDLQDYQPGADGVCSTTAMEGKSKRMLKVTNYGYNLLGIAFPCILILFLSGFLICRTASIKKHRIEKKMGVKSDSNNTVNEMQPSDHISSHYCILSCYIAAILGILHALFNLPARLSDTLLMSLSPYSKQYVHLMNFSHQAQSFISLSYTYKCFVCILISQRFRSQAKSVICFLIENKYDQQSLILKNHPLNNKFISQRTTQRHQQDTPIIDCPIVKPEQVTIRFSKTSICCEDDRERVPHKQVIVQSNQFNSKVNRDISHTNDEKFFIIENYSWNSSWLRAFTKTLSAQYKDKQKNKHRTALTRSNSCQPFIYTRPNVQMSPVDNENVSLISSINDDIEVSTSMGNPTLPNKQCMLNKQTTNSTCIQSQTSTDLSYFSLPYGSKTQANLPMPNNRAPYRNNSTKNTRLRQTPKTNDDILTNPHSIQNFLSFSYALCNNNY